MVSADESRWRACFNHLLIITFGNAIKRISVTFVAVLSSQYYFTPFYKEMRAVACRFEHLGSHGYGRIIKSHWRKNWRFEIIYLLTPKMKRILIRGEKN